MYDMRDKESNLTYGPPKEKEEMSERAMITDAKHAYANETGMRQETGEQYGAHSNIKEWSGMIRGGYVDIFSW